jgi:HlyD family type I secretion membrane fusion protein
MTELVSSGGGARESIPAMLAARRREAPVSRGAMGYGFAIVLGFWGLFGVAASTAPLDSAAVAQGVINVKNKQQVVQHLEGGLISAIHVREGDHVSAGDPLITLDIGKAEMVRTILTGRLMAARALAARLRADRDGLDGIEFDFNNAELNNSEALDAMTGQLRIFEARRDALRSQREILKQRIGQLHAEIAGLREQIAAQTRQSELIDTEIKGVAALVKKGLERQSRLLSLQRAQAEIDKSQALARASIARGEQRIGETQLQGKDVQVQFLGEVVGEMREIDDAMFDYRERLRDAETTLERTQVRAGVDGVVVGLKVYTVGGVIAPGAEIMSLVPDDDPLIVEARVDPNDIDIVKTGLLARVRLTAFSQRSVDVVTGEVFTVSADRLTDPNTQMSYYLAKIRLDEESIPADAKGRIIPGMGIEVMIRTGERTLFEYLTKPLRDSFARSLTED